MTSLKEMEMNAEMNRLGNTQNPYQGSAKRVLCVCSAGILRSPTAANILHEEYGFNTRSAGVSREYALIPVDKALMYWADEIVCMDADQEAILKARFEEYQLTPIPVYNLNIPDAYCWGDPVLEEMISERYREFA